MNSSKNITTVVVNSNNPWFQNLRVEGNLITNNPQKGDPLRSLVFGNVPISEGNNLIRIKVVKLSYRASPPSFGVADLSFFSNSNSNRKSPNLIFFFGTGNVYDMISKFIIKNGEGIQEGQIV